MGWLLLVVALVATAPVRADTLRVFAAGSLSGAFSDLLRRFPNGAATIAPPEFGPSGLLRERIEAGAPASLLASADMAQARRLAAGHPERSVIEFTRNRLCAIARQAVGLTQANMLDRLLDPPVRLATSTPGADPAGDYAWQVFARAESVRPGARAALEGKALKLVGGGDKTPLLVPGKGAVEGMFLADRADVMLGYCSGAADVLRAVPGLVSVPLPAEISVGPAYGMAVLDGSPVTLRFAAFVMSETEQTILAAHGFDPVALPPGAKPEAGVLVQRQGQAARLLTRERIGALPQVTETATITSGHGADTSAWTGPLLWDVLAMTGAGPRPRAADRPRHRGRRLQRGIRPGRARPRSGRPADPARPAQRRPAAPQWRVLSHSTRGQARGAVGAGRGANRGRVAL